MKHNIRSLKELKTQGTPITWLTCYEYSFATALNSTDLDMILVGDSGGMVALGYGDTVPVTMDEMIFLASSVRRGAPDKFIVGDMPKGSYEVSDEDAVRNAMRFAKEAGCDAVKLEGGQIMASRVRAIVDSGITVIGHIGLTPQSSGALGGYRVIGRDVKEVQDMKLSIEALESAGAFAILVEALPPVVSEEIQKMAKSIIFGIGAGLPVDGQLLILHDALGLYPKFRPKFAKNYVPSILHEFSKELSKQENVIEYGRETRRDGLHEITRLAVNEYIRDVRTKNFPSSEYSYKN